MQTHATIRQRTRISDAGPIEEGVRTGEANGRSSSLRRRNRVYKSLHKPLTYLGVERTLFSFVCVAAVGAFNLFNSLLAGIAVFLGGFAFGHWVTNMDPAFLRILARSERYNTRYDPAKHTIPQVEVR
jgi:type IV secretory pathway TrbD component